MSAEHFASVGMDIAHFLDTDISVEKPFKEMQIHFKNIKNLVAIFSAAIQKLAEGVIPDPIVGETACQLRAGLYAEIVNAPDYRDLIAQSHYILGVAQKRLENSTFKIVKGGAQITSHDSQTVEFKSKAIINMCQFLNIDTQIHMKIALLAEGVILEMATPCVYSFSLENGCVNPTQTQLERSAPELSANGFSSKGSVKRLTECIKRHLSQKSVEHIVECATRTKPPDVAARLTRMVSGDRVKDTRLGYRTIPCFSSSQVVFQRAAEVAIPLVVRIFRTDAATASVAGVVELFYLSDEGKYHPVPREEITVKSSAILCEAISAASPPLSEEEIRKEITNRDIVETIMAFMATHPVYGGELNKCKGHDEETQSRKPYKAIAKEFGFCKKNQKVCRPFHVLAVPTKQFFVEDKS